MYSNELLDSILIGLEANKRDLSFHNLNLERYKNILADEDLEEGDFKDKMINEIPVLESRIREINLIIKHTESQLKGVSEKDLIASRERIVLVDKQE